MAFDSGFPLENVNKRFQELEDKYNLFHYEHDGWCLWPILRLRVADFLTDLPWDNLREKKKFGIHRRLPVIISDLPKLFRPPKAPIVVKTYASKLREKQGERFKDIFIDDLLVSIGSRDYFKIEGVNSDAFYDRSKKSLIRKDISSYFFDSLPKAVANRFIRARPLSQMAQNFAVIFKQELNLENLNQKWIVRILSQFFLEKKIYGWLFDRVEPDYIIMPTHSEYSMVAAAKERNITVIEFQHGSPDCHKIPYSWSNNAIPVKAKIPIPDQIFLYGEFFRKSLKKNNFWDSELLPVGSLRIDKYRIERTKYKTREKSEVLTILITTQGLDVQRTIEFFQAVLRMAEKKIKIKLYFKLHPFYEAKSDLYVEAFNPYQNVVIQLGNQEPSTFELLVRSDFHVSIYSTTHYEALALGIPTIILPFTNYELMTPLASAGHAYIVHSPAEFLEIIRNHGDGMLGEDISSYYSKPDALKNMKTALKL